MERLQKVIAASGVASRRKAEELILKGCVSVNGEKVTELGTKVNGNDLICVNGKSITEEDKVYFMLNKPRGIISSVKDELNRKTVVDLIDTDKRIYPIGRLDYDTTGLLLLTNDGELSNILTHPNFNVEKTYVAKLNKFLEPSDFMKLKNGVMTDGRICKPTKVRLKENNKIKNYAYVEVTIVEGRNHIIKRLFMELGYLVDKLTRTSYAGMSLGTMKSGEYRSLTIKEVKRLYEYGTSNNK